MQYNPIRNVRGYTNKPLNEDNRESIYLSWNNFEKVKSETYLQDPISWLKCGTDITIKILSSDNAKEFLTIKLVLKER